jgi:predicted DNA-binding WGR domain protein
MTTEWTRCFEGKGTSGKKFWNCTVRNNMVTIRFGRAGTKGSERTSEFGSFAEASGFAESVLESKMRKGYTEVHHEQVGHSLPSRLLGTSASAFASPEPKQPRPSRKVTVRAFYRLGPPEPESFTIDLDD